jgi:preprotein translocase subunit SecG
MFSILLAIQILVSISIIALVMLQQGKGADMGAAFGSGSSGTVFGSRGSGSFLTRATAFLAVIFFINCLLIASPLVRESSMSNESIGEQLEQQQEAAEAASTAEALEQQPEASPADITGRSPVTTMDDVPGGAALQPDRSAADDLPE